MISCTRIFRFEAAHRLYGHQGRCQFLHGHSYKVEVTVTAPGLDELGMVVDFGNLEEAVGGFINSNWDHACILKSVDPIIKQFYPPKGALKGMRYYSMEGNPTAENMAQELLDVCNRSFFRGSPISIVRVTIWETENSFATAEV